MLETMAAERRALTEEDASRDVSQVIDRIKAVPLTPEKNVGKRSRGAAANEVRLTELPVSVHFAAKLMCGSM